MTILRSGRSFVAVVATAAACLAPATTVLGGDSPFGPTQVLRTASPGVDLHVADVATSGAHTAVAWHETRPGGPRAFVRFESGEGEAFGPLRRLAATPLGGIARDPRAAWCGDALWVLSRTPGGVVLDRFVGASQDSLAWGPAGSSRPEIACAGDRRVVTAWVDRSTDPARVTVTAHDNDIQCDECVPTQAFDLGPIDFGERVTIAATPRRIYAAWVADDRIRFKRFVIADDADATVTELPAMTLLRVSRGDGGHPNLAAQRERVVLAYQLRGDTRVRISTNRGGTFQPPATLVDVADRDHDTSYPSSVDVNSAGILVEALRVRIGCASSGVAGCGDEGFVEDVTARAFLLGDAGGPGWEVLPGSWHRGGDQLGAMFAEAWDRARLDPPPTRQRLLFHATP